MKGIKYIGGLILILILVAGCSAPSNNNMDAIISEEESNNKANAALIADILPSATSLVLNALNNQDLGSMTITFSDSAPEIKPDRGVRNETTSYIITAIFNSASVKGQLVYNLTTNEAVDKITGFSVSNGYLSFPRTPISTAAQNVTGVKFSGVVVSGASITEGKFSVATPVVDVTESQLVVNGTSYSEKASPSDYAEMLYYIALNKMFKDASSASETIKLTNASVTTADSTASINMSLQLTGYNYAYFANGPYVSDTSRTATGNMTVVFEGDYNSETKEVSVTDIVFTFNDLELSKNVSEYDVRNAVLEGVLNVSEIEKYTTITITLNENGDNISDTTQPTSVPVKNKQAPAITGNATINGISLASVLEVVGDNL